MCNSYNIMDEISDEKKDFIELLDFSESKKEFIIDNIINNNKKSFLFDTIDISKDVYKDTLIDKWIGTLPELYGSKKLIKEIIYNPINNQKLLEDRQKSYVIDDIDFSILREHEDDLLWIYKLNDEIKESNSINILFPSTFLISYINHFTPLLDFFHIYKIYFIPITSIIYPIMSIFAPLFYVNKYLNLNMSVVSYIKMLYNFIKIIFIPTGNFKIDVIKTVSFIGYVSLYLYNMYQTVEYAYMLYETKYNLMKKMNGLVSYIKEALYIIKSVPEYIIKPFLNINIEELELLNTMTNIYKIWKSNELKDKLTSILLTTYTIDIINSITKLKNKNWIDVNYNTKNTQIWDMKNPVLNDKQSANPISLTKNIIITGPNAAGKTTYVKSILSNIIMGQTFGISYSKKANIILYDAINSFMRITDILGEKSYFEVEAEYCLSMINKATKLQKEGKKGLFLMDEPMHSTPPTEGMATAYAVAEYIGKMSDINIIITTHFYKLTVLEDLYPDKFINLSVDAIKNPNGGFIFPYKIKRGHSYQCIAIELLSVKEYPIDVIESAINMKNKIYEELNSK